MSKLEKIHFFLQGIGLNPDSKRYERAVEYALTKSKPFQMKVGTYSPTDEVDFGLKPETDIQSCMCPCDACGHEFMWECDDAGCACCSSACC